MYKSHNCMHKMRIMPDFSVRPHYGNPEKKAISILRTFQEIRIRGLKKTAADVILKRK